MHYNYVCLPGSFNSVSSLLNMENSWYLNTNSIYENVSEELKNSSHSFYKCGAHSLPLDDTEWRKKTMSKLTHLTTNACWGPWEGIIRLGSSQSGQALRKCTAGEDPGMQHVIIGWGIIEERLWGKSTVKEVEKRYLKQTFPTAQVCVG